MRISDWSSYVCSSDLGNISCVSGMVASPTHSEAVTALQAANSLEQLDARLTAAGSSRSRLLSVNIWLADIGDWADVNAVWTPWLGGIAGPARATGQAGLVQAYRAAIAPFAARRGAPPQLVPHTISIWLLPQPSMTEEEQGRITE